MEDRNTIKNIYEQVKDINENNKSSMEQFTSIELLLQSNNNGTVKDAEISKEFTRMKSKMEELSEATDQFMNSLNNHK